MNYKFVPWDDERLDSRKKVYLHGDWKRNTFRESAGFGQLHRWLNFCYALKRQDAQRW